MIYRNLFFTCLLFLYCFTLTAQKSIIRSTDLSFSKEGTIVNCVEQDKNGLLWLGTSEGIFTFNGSELNQVYSHYSISALYLEENKVHFGTENGFLGIFENNNFKIHKLCSSPVSNIKNSDSGIVLTTFGEGVFIVSNSDTVNYNADNSELIDNYCYSLQVENGNKLWISSDRGINQLHVSDGKLLKSYSEKEMLPDKLCFSLLFRNNILFAGSYGKGIIRINPESGQFDLVKGSEKGAIHKMLNYGKDLYFLADSGVFEYNIESGQVIQLIGNYSFNHILISPEGLLFCVGNRNQLFQIDLRFSEYFEIESKSMSDISAMYAFGDSLFIATAEGIYLFDEGENFKEIHTSSPFPNIISLFYNKKVLWAGSFGEGLFRIDLGELNPKNVSKVPGLLDNNILSISGNSDFIWLATLGGFSTVNIQNDAFEIENYGPNSPLGSNYIYKVLETDSFGVLIGSDGKGLRWYSNGGFHDVIDSSYNYGRSIIGLTKNKTGDIYFSSLEGGVYKLDFQKKKAKKVFNDISGYRFETLTSINDHIFSFGDGKLIDHSPERTIIFRNSNGIEELNTNYLNSLIADGSDKIWMGTRNSLIRYDPFLAAQQKPLVYISEFLKFLQPVDSAALKDMETEENHIAFRFDASWLQNPQALEFKYKLEGFDLEWIATKDRIAIYPQLPYGEYNFKVFAFVNDEQIEEARSFAFKINPPIYLQPWFIITAFLLLILIIYVIIRIREHYFLQKQAVEKERILSQFAVLKNQINPHFLFNSFNTLASVIETDKNKAVEYVDKLSDYFRVLLVENRNDVISLEKELRLLDNYIYLQRQRFGDAIQLQITIEEDNMDSLIPPLTLQLLAENAVKHNKVSKKYPLIISLTSTAGHLIFRNNLQVKAEVEKSTGTGLSNIRNRYKLLFQEKVEIELSAQFFEVRLPIIKA